MKRNNQPMYGETTPLRLVNSSRVRHPCCRKSGKLYCCRATAYYVFAFGFEHLTPTFRATRTNLLNMMSYICDHGLDYASCCENNNNMYVRHLHV